MKLENTIHKSHNFYHTTRCSNEKEIIVGVETELGTRIPLIPFEYFDSRHWIQLFILKRRGCRSIAERNAVKNV